MSEPSNPPADLAEITALVRGFEGVPGGLLPALHAVQHHAGHVDTALIPVLADTFNLAVAEVHGVVSFYKDFGTTPPKGPLVQVCRAEACQARGANAVFDAAVAAADGQPVEVQEVFCLGLCTQGPSVIAAGRLHGGVDADEIVSIIGSVARRDHAPLEVPTGGDGVTVYVPGDAAARAAGADDVAAALAAQPGVRVVRNGSRGMLWLEPLVEVATADGRVAYGNVTAADVPALLAAGLLEGGDHSSRLGLVDELPWMQGQQRVTFGRVGVIDPRDPDDYVAHGGLEGLRRALAMQPADVVTEVTDSGLRGRGGAAFPTGIKLRTVLDTPSDRKYIVANADEGDSGTFADRMVMEGDPFLLVEGMIIAGWAVGASDGYVYIRSEYPDAIATMESAVATAETLGWLTPREGSSSSGVLGSDFRFRLHVRVGAGAYICGEETALLESLEGRRGIVRAKPPLPAIEGLWGRPTVINNVLSLAALPSILGDGAAAYAALGHGRSRGTQVVQLAGNIARGGIIEVPFGVTVREIIDQWGGGTASGRPVRTAQVGGPLGAYLSDEQMDLPLDYEAFNAAGALLGHGSIVVFDDTVDMSAMARFAMEFCAAESCGKCTPCRIGST
ncbi:MAG: NAD(P)H-dependent oxidoreductase subunit E, partial [Ilumatobacteraceae bacterium]